MRHLTRYLGYVAAAGLCLAGFIGTDAHAGIVITGTRAIYPAADREITIGLTNDEKKTPRLVQAWIDGGDATISPDKADVPFHITPPVFRMEPGASQSLRVVYTKEPLPTDKESLFWLNVLEVPPKSTDAADANVLQFAFRTRIKLFFRPDGLRGQAQDAPKALTWTLANNGSSSALQVNNPTPYYVSFQSVALAQGDKLDEASDDMSMVAPFGTLSISLKNKIATPAANAEVRFKTINDAGGFVPFTAPLKP
ncbi:molecular chaperone [Dyella flava]|uniref:Fimbria/pilus periplasmic chaperone n=1 Tax=Dyella flava TaxID=1920170 RepID=A0ABS2K612_9GAMM|nr:fimbria/pilus periplasmic chaperone [Dyella flava]MBM7126641.1 fimbria/pilus periplasmic chaperone [Dyella flava]GLQ49539.1 fimbria-related chaperone [Dyella flava]